MRWVATSAGDAIAGAIWSTWSWLGKRLWPRPRPGEVLAGVGEQQ